MTDEQRPAGRVTNDAALQRYEIAVDGERAGLTAYVDDGDQRIYYHTEVGEKFRGRGLAGALISAALADTRAAGKRIVPICPFVAGYLEKHRDYDDIADPVTPAAIAAVKSHLG